MTDDSFDFIDRLLVPHGREKERGQPQSIVKEGGKSKRSASGQTKVVALSMPPSHHRAQRARLLFRGQGLGPGLELGQGLGLEHGQVEMKEGGLDEDDIDHDDNDGNEGGDDDEDDEEDGVGDGGGDINNDHDEEVDKGESEDEDEDEDSMPLWLQKLSDSSPLVRL